MIAPLLKSALAPVVDSHRRLRLCHWTTLWWLAGAAAGALLLALPEASRGRWPAALLIGTAVGFFILRVLSRLWHPDFREIARRIERGHPELHALLVTAVEQRPDTRTGQLHYLQQRVVDDAVRVTRERQWLDAISPLSWFGAYGLQIVALVAMLFVFRELELPTAQSSSSQRPVGAGLSVTVTPGDTELERGSGLVVLAKFQGDVPAEATLVLQPRNAAPQRLNLVRSLKDPVFGGGLPEVPDDLVYHVEYAGQTTRDFAVHVFEHPRLDRADATLRYPAYTKLPEKSIPDTHRVSAVEGTKLDVDFQLNKAVKSATLVAKDGAEVPLAVELGKATAGLHGFDIAKSQSYELRLVDGEGRANKLPARFVIEALPNRKPELKFVAPKGDRRVSPIEEITFRGEAWDDFGLARYGMTVNVASQGEKEIEFGRDSHADERREFTNVLKLEDLGVKPDELLSWYLWAEDTGPDGQIRRTASDMYFGEVRPFEEIYRAGDSAQAEQREQQQQQQGGGAGNQAENLAKTQKQIITATWNLQRSEGAGGADHKPTDKYLKDEPVIRDSQTDALNQAQTMSEKLTDPKSIAFVQNVTREMQTAKDRLTEAAETSTPLPTALTAEQAAYNALLKLSAHEFEVTRRKNQKGQGQGQQANQRELDELEMKEEKQRYETAKEAAPAQNKQQREQLAVLNRLKELAQRQQDINERLKELQAALQEAKTPKEKEELTKQLERLRESEQQLLSDLDESKQSMEKASEQAQLAEARQKLEQTRSEAQQAAESMKQNEPSKALASGSRAARQLQEIRDDIRKKSSGQFNDEMRDMRNEARELAQNQQAIEDKLQAESPPPPDHPTLESGDQHPEDVAKDLEKQRTQLADLTEKMKRVSEEADAVEPLLSKELYDTLRKTTQAGADRKLEAVKALAERGINRQAEQIEKNARKDVEDLKTGVERAAESVLGNEAESLKLARDELDALAHQLNQEIGQARPDRALNRQPGNKSNPASASGQERPDASDPAEAGNDQKGNTAQRNRNPGQGQAQDANQSNDPAQSEQGSGEATARNEQNPSDGKTPSANRSGRQSGQNVAQAQTPNDANPDRNNDARQQPGQRSQGRQPGQGGQQGEDGQTADAGEPQTPPNEQPDSARTARAGQRNGRGGARGQQPGREEQGQGGAENDNAAQNAETAQAAGAETLNRQAASAAGGGGAGGGAITGGGYVDWSDRLRNVEEMLDSPQLRNEAARIRELAKGVRIEYKKNSSKDAAKQPDWDMVNSKIRQPLVELRNRLSEELARRDSKESLVPIDRDPVPPKYAERVRSYYEELGRSK